MCNRQKLSNLILECFNQPISEEPYTIFWNVHIFLIHMHHFTKHKSLNLEQYTLELVVRKWYKGFVKQHPGQQ